MTASQKSRRQAAAVTFYLPESPPTLACARERTCGLARTGTLGTPPVQHSCPCATISVLELRSSFDCVVKRSAPAPNARRTRRKAKQDEANTFHARPARVRHRCARSKSAGQTHRDARRRHDLKFLSIRGEAAPRAPVWRSKSGCEFVGRKSRCHSQGGRTH